MVVGDRALAAHRGRDRRLEQLGDGRELASAPAIAAAAADEHRLARRASASAAASTWRLVRPDAARREHAERRIAAHIGLVDRMALDVEGQADVRSSRPPASLPETRL